jgi:acyl-ACP thioesterase
MGLSQDRKSYSKEFTVNVFECDHRNRLSISYIFRHSQQISGEHLDAMGYPYERLYDAGQVFLLSKVRAQIFSLPGYGDVVTIVTRPNTPQGCQFIRRTQFLAQDGSLLVDIDTTWMLVEPSSRKILRPSAFICDMQTTEAQEENPVPGKGSLLRGGAVRRFPQNLLNDIDVNLHLNNARYADLVCDALEEELFEERQVKSIIIHYQKEAKLGAQLELFTGRPEPDGRYVSAYDGEHRCFEAYVELQ